MANASGQKGSLEASLLDSESSWPVIGRDLMTAVRAARDFGLHPACVPGPELTEFLKAVLASQQARINRHSNRLDNNNSEVNARAQGPPLDWRC
eukprot:scaffold234519_cov25-Prasinocladus_malaysianus.AAC.1